MEKSRYINRLHWVFDLADDIGIPHIGKAPPRVMIIYDRESNRTRVEILDKELSQNERRRISSWLQKNGPVHDVLNDLA